MKFTAGIDDIFFVNFMPGGTLPQFAGKTSDEAEKEIGLYQRCQPCGCY